MFRGEVWLFGQGWKKNSAPQMKIRGSFEQSKGGGRGVGQEWECYNSVILVSRRMACLQHPSPELLSAWFCQRTGDWRRETAVWRGRSETGFARSVVHVRSTGDAGSWKGDICSTSCQATSATLIVPLTPFLQKLSVCSLRVSYLADIYPLPLLHYWLFFLCFLCWKQSSLEQLKQATTNRLSIILALC